MTPISRSTPLALLAALLLGACTGMPAAPPARDTSATETRPAPRASTRRAQPAIATPERARPGLVAEPPPPDPASNIFFASGSDRIGPAGRRLLQEMADKLKGKVRVDITLVGHTDDAGSTEFNISLAQKRVEAVANELESMGVSPRQIRRISYGNEASGPTTCGTTICRDRERRVELRLSDAD